MEKFKPLIWVFLFGSLWGISEAVGGGALYAANIPLASVWLSSWALFLLAFARAQNNKPGTSSAIGGIAVLFRLVNAAPFICHLLGIFLLGVAFDLAATFLLKRKEKALLRGGLTGILGAYGGYVSFALIITYIVQYKTWVAGGWPKNGRAHIFEWKFDSFCIGFFGPSWLLAQPKGKYIQSLPFQMGHEQRSGPHLLSMDTWTAYRILKPASSNIFYLDIFIKGNFTS